MKYNLTLRVPSCMDGEPGWDPPWELPCWIILYSQPETLAEIPGRIEELKTELQKHLWMDNCQLGEPCWTGFDNQTSSYLVRHLELDEKSYVIIDQ